LKRGLRKVFSQIKKADLDAYVGRGNKYDSTLNEAMKDCIPRSQSKLVADGISD